MRLVLQHIITGTPVPWARARVGLHEGGGAGDGGRWQRSFHTAPEQKRYKGLVRDEVALAYRSAKARGDHDGKPIPLGTALLFEARVFLPIPLAFNRQEEWSAREGHIRPTGKPDLDNWLKLPMDACEGILYANDSQVVEFGNSGKFYATKGRLELRVVVL